MSNLTAIQQDQILQSFFNSNSNINLLTFNFLDEKAVNEINWQDLDKDTILERLKAYQRLLRLDLEPNAAKNLLDASQIKAQSAASASTLTSETTLSTWT